MSVPVVVVLCGLFWLSSAQNSFYLSATVRDFSKTYTPDFGTSVTVGDNSTEFVNTTLNMFSLPFLKPKITLTTVDSNKFPNWFSVPFTNTSDQLATSETAYSLRFDQIGGTSVYQFAAFPFYPIDNLLNGNEGDPHNLYFTLQLNMYFTYTPPMSLKFGSSDDMWVFINNTLVNTGLRGIHSYYNATVNLATLGLGSGKTYLMSVFYAHRSSAHVPQILIQIPASSQCNAVSAGLRVQDLYPFTGSNLAIPAGSVSTVVTEAGVTKLRIVPRGTPSVGASAWFPEQLPVQNGFRTEFSVRIQRMNYNATAFVEGFAFVWQNTDATARGSSQSNLGYDFANCTAIEFDCYHDPGIDAINGQHIDLHTAYTSPNGPSASTLTTVPYRLTPLNTNGINMADNQTHTAQISYSPGATTGTVMVWWDGRLVLVSTLDMTRVRQAYAGGVAYFGFTASNAALFTADVDISNWKLWTVPASAPQSTAIPNPPASWQTVQANDAIGSPAFFVQSNDACGSSIPNGGGNLVAYLSPVGMDKAIGSSSTLDKNDGTYNVWFWYNVTASLSLIVRLNNQAITGSPFSVAITYGPAATKYTSYTGNNLQNFVAGVPKTVTSLPKTDLATTTSTVDCSSWCCSTADRPSPTTSTRPRTCTISTFRPPLRPTTSSLCVWVVSTWVRVRCPW